MKTRFVSGKLKILVILFVIAAPIFWYWFWGWGTLHIIDFSAQDVEYVNISCSHLRKIGTVRDPEEIQALIDEANSMQNRGTSLKELIHGIFQGGGVLYDLDFYLTDGTEFLLVFFSGDAYGPVSNKRLSYWYYSPTGEQIHGPMCQGSLEVYARLFEKYNQVFPPL